MVFVGARQEPIELDEGEPEFAQPGAWAEFRGSWCGTRLGTLQGDMFPVSFYMALWFYRFATSRLSLFGTFIRVGNGGLKPWLDNSPSATNQIEYQRRDPGPNQAAKRRTLHEPRTISIGFRWLEDTAEQPGVPTKIRGTPNM